MRPFGDLLKLSDLSECLCRPEMPPVKALGTSNLAPSATELSKIGHMQHSEALLERRAMYCLSNVGISKTAYPHCQRDSATLR